MRFLYSILFLLSFTISIQAQNIDYGVVLDTNAMLIGEQQTLSFQLRTDTRLSIQFPILKDTVVSGVEILDGPLLDSIQEKDGRWLYSSNYRITSFDTGVYYVPKYDITIEGDEYNNILKTDSVAFAVTTYNVDEKKGSFDIVMPYDANWTLKEILPYILGFLAILIVIALIMWIVIRVKAKKSIFSSSKVFIPPYVLIMRSLSEISDSKLWQTENAKEYYTKLTDAVRLYVSGEFSVSAMEHTSSETVAELKGKAVLTDNELNIISDIFSTADYVKFAKLTPLFDENKRYLDMAYLFVATTHERIEAAKEAEKAKQEELQGQKNK